MKFLSLLILSVSLSASHASARVFHDVTMPDTIKVQGQDLVLNGMGLREVSVFMIVVRVYVAGLYVPKTTSDCDGVVASTGLRQVDMHFLRHVSSGDLKENLEKSVKANCGDKCDALKEQVEKLKGLVPAPKSDDVLHITFDSKGTEFVLNDKNLGRVEGVDFSRALLSAFIGKNPVTQDLKKGLCTPAAGAH